MHLTEFKSKYVYIYIEGIPIECRQWMSVEVKVKCNNWMEGIDCMVAKTKSQTDFYELGHLKRVFLDQLARDERKATHLLGFDSQSILAFMQSLDRLPEEDIRTFLKEASRYIF